MKKYDSYKDSGIEWIGEIPSHWEVLRFKNLFIEHSGNGFPIEMQGKETGEIPFYKVSNLNGEGQFVELSNNYVSNEDVLKMKWNIVPADTILTAKIGESLRKNHRKISKTPCIIDNNCLGIESKIIDKKLAFYLLENTDFDWFTNPGAVPSVSMEKLRYHIFPITKNSQEQTAIANYLDQKTTQIDDLITKKERLIQLLEEERTDIINQAVTKGLDPTVPMKDSGIEWLGEIPANWEVMRLRNIVDTVKTGSTPPSDEIQYFEPQEINWYGPGDFENLILGEAKRKISHLAIEENKCRLFPSNSILLIGIGATVGKVGLITEPSSSNQQINAIILKEFYNPIFYLFFLASIKEIIIMEASSATLPIFNQTQTKNIIITVPPIEEQNQIVGFIKNQTERIQTISAKTKQEIELLKEYKTALISEVVTGKVDVRNEKLS